jgi:hypothetical protein
MVQSAPKTDGRKHRSFFLCLSSCLKVRYAPFGKVAGSGMCLPGARPDGRSAELPTGVGRVPAVFLPFSPTQ